MFVNVKGYFAGIAPNRSVVGAPERRLLFWKSPAPRSALGLRKRKPSNLLVTIWEMPSDGDGVGTRFAWGYGALKQNRASIPPASIDLVGSVIGSESPVGNFAPECGQRVEFPAWSHMPLMRGLVPTAIREALP